jgi:hypothetical protein
MDKPGTVQAVATETNSRNTTDIISEPMSSAMPDQGGPELVAAQVRAPLEPELLIF